MSGAWTGVTPTQGIGAGGRIAAALVTMLVLVGCGGGDEDAAPAETTTSASPPAVGEALRLGERSALRIDIPSPDWLAADDEHLYVKLDGGRVERVDPATGAVLASAEIVGEGGTSGSGCQGIGVGFDSVWSCFGGDVVRFGLDPFEELSRIPAGKAAAQGHLATGLGRVWVLQGDGSSLVGIDPETEAMDEPFPLPIRGTDVAIAGGGIWIVSALDDAVVVIDPADGAVAQRVDLPGAAFLSVVDDVVWVGGSDTVHRFEEASAAGSLVGEGGPGARGALAADDAVWVRRVNEVRRVDPASGAELEAFTLDLSDNSPGDMVVAFDALWITGSEDGALFRVDLG